MALSADRNATYREGVEIEIPVDGGSTIYAGSLVSVNAAGYAVPASDTAGTKFMGVAQEQADNSGGSDGDINVRVRTEGVFEFLASSITQAMVGDAMYIVDDQTFDDAAGPSNDIICGRLVKFVSITKGWIDIAKRWVS